MLNLARRTAGGSTTSLCGCRGALSGSGAISGMSGRARDVRTAVASLYSETVSLRKLAVAVGLLKSCATLRSQPAGSPRPRSPPGLR